MRRNSLCMCEKIWGEVMQFPKDHEYFSDIREDGTLDSSVTDGSDSALGVFARSIAEEQERDLGFTVSSDMGKEGLKRNTEYKINGIVNRIWWKCIRDLNMRDRKTIGRFPREMYHVAQMVNEEDVVYDVTIDCKEKIEMAAYRQLLDLDDLTLDYRNSQKMREMLKKASILGIINMLLCLTYALTQLYELPGCALGFLLGPLILIFFFAAVIQHRDRANNVFFDVLVVLGCTAVPIVVHFGECEEPESFSMIMLLIGLSVWYGILYVIHYVAACKPVRQYKKALAALDPGIHKEIRFMQLWYKHMTGEFSESLQKVEDKLLHYLSLRG